MTNTDDRPAIVDARSTLPTHLEHFRRRVLYDALLEATSTYWLRRAETFTQVGNARCDEIAQACRNHAELLKTTGLDTEATTVIADILGHPLDADQAVVA